MPVMPSGVEHAVAEPSRDVEGTIVESQRYRRQLWREPRWIAREVLFRVCSLVETAWRIGVFIPVGVLWGFLGWWLLDPLGCRAGLRILWQSSPDDMVQARDTFWLLVSYIWIGVVCFSELLLFKRGPIDREVQRYMHWLADRRAREEL
jgi:hypothetical protein